MRKTRSLVRRSFYTCAATCLLAATGCVQPIKYNLTTMPTPPTPVFRNIQVGEVGLGVTADSLDVAAPIVLREAIANAIIKSKRYEAVSMDESEGDATLRIDCVIVEFERGSQLSRWLIGRFGAKAHLDASCRFTGPTSDRLFAEGTFSGEVQGGMFGGSANLEKMSKDVASGISKFLQKGR